MAQVSPANDRKRVKVYELKNSDWFDRGTGFCRGVRINDDARILVTSEDDPNRVLLETKISREDTYQKQQETLIVWTEANGTDMALSFQEAEGCSAIWEFVCERQSQLQARAQEDGLSDDMGEHAPPTIILPVPSMGNLHEIENMMRAASSTPGGREALVKFILDEKNGNYIKKLLPVFELAEEFRGLTELHRLCSIMKMLILLNDTAIIETCVNDEVLDGVVGALEYDPDFPLHKAKHREFLSDKSRFKEVVKIEDPGIRQRIHYAYRLQYLKDVVLARILDDPTFGVLNSLIFYHQVDVTQRLQDNPAYVKELFGIFSSTESSLQRKKDAVMIIQQFCATAKSLNGQTRQNMYQNFINHGLLDVIQYALKNADATVRVAGSDTLVALIEHDSMLVRHIVFKAALEKGKPLTDTLIELLLVEVDLGVKAQMADAVKHLLDPNAIHSSVETLSRVNPDFSNKLRLSYPTSHPDAFVQTFYEDSARKLFKPLQDLKERESIENLTIAEVDLFLHLVEILGHFFRQHHFRSKYFILSEELPVRVALLLKSSEKHLKLAAIRFFRTTLQLKDEYLNRQLMDCDLFGPILQVVYDTMPRNNLLNSACLELFEWIIRETPIQKDLLVHVVTKYRERLENITYVDTFKRLIDKYEKMIAPVPTQELEHSFTSVDSGTPARHVEVLVNGGKWGQALKELDPHEEAYFNGSDDDEADILASNDGMNGACPVRPLVNYPDEDDGDDDEMDILATSTPSASPAKSATASQSPITPNTRPSSRANSKTPPERISEKRRREEEEEDELLANIPGSGTKRKAGLLTSSSTESTQKLRRKNSMSSAKDSGAPKKLHLSLPLKSNDDDGGGGGGGGGGTEDI